MKKLVAALVLFAPVALGLSACGSDKTYVVTPPAAQAAPSAGSNTVVVPQGSTVTRVCPQGASTC